MKIVQIFDTKEEADNAFNNFCKYNKNYFNINSCWRKATNDSIVFEFIWCKETENNPLGCVQAEVLQYFGTSDVVSNWVMSRVGKFRNTPMKMPKSMNDMVKDFIKKFE